MASTKRNSFQYIFTGKRNQMVLRKSGKNVQQNQDLEEQLSLLIRVLKNKLHLHLKARAFMYHFKLTSNHFQVHQAVL